MAQTLDYNKSVTNVYPVVPTLDEDMFIISKLDDEPNDVGGLSADQLKAEFDKAGRIISDYINTGLIPAVLASDLTEQTRAAAEAERVTNEQERVSNENKRIADETARKSAEDLRVTHENERVASEEIRNENENIRVSNEQQRIINETERQDLERGYVAQSKNNADAAIAAKNAAEKARDEAKEIVDGDFIPASEKGAAGGVAELDATGKVPAAQLPATMTPAAHADTHKQGGDDPLLANDVGAVSKDGDIMTGGTLGFNGGYGRIVVGQKTFNLYMYDNADGSGGFRRLEFNNPAYMDDKNALRLHVDRGTYSIFGEHNKPAGTYVGNGSTSLRYVAAGGYISRFAVICTENTMALVSTAGTLRCQTDAITFSQTAAVHPTAGIAIATDHVALNANGVTYTYWWL